MTDNGVCYKSGACWRVCQHVTAMSQLCHSFQNAYRPMHNTPKKTHHMHSRIHALCESQPHHKQPHHPQPQGTLKNTRCSCHQQSPVQKGADHTAQLQTLPCMISKVRVQMLLQYSNRSSLNDGVWPSGVTRMCKSELPYAQVLWDPYSKISQIQEIQRHTAKHHLTVETTDGSTPKNATAQLHTSQQVQQRTILRSPEYQNYKQ